MKGTRTLDQLQGDLEKICDPDWVPKNNQVPNKRNFLKPNSHIKVRFFFDLMKVVQDQALSLNKDRQIVSVKREGFVEMGLNGK